MAARARSRRACRDLRAALAPRRARALRHRPAGQQCRRARRQRKRPAPRRADHACRSSASCCCSSSARVVATTLPLLLGGASVALALADDVPAVVFDRHLDFRAEHRVDDRPGARHRLLADRRQSLRRRARQRPRSTRGRRRDDGLRRALDRVLRRDGVRGMLLSDAVHRSAGRSLDEPGGHARRGHRRTGRSDAAAGDCWRFLVRAFTGCACLAEAHAGTARDTASGTASASASCAIPGSGCSARSAVLTRPDAAGAGPAPDGSRSGWTAGQRRVHARHAGSLARLRRQSAGAHPDRREHRPAQWRVHACVPDSPPETE